MTQTEDTDRKVGHPQGPSRRQSWKMFDRIAHRYDLLNHLLSGNIDKRWRNRLTDQLTDRDGQKVLDLATGTGDQLVALLRHPGVASGIGIDMSEQMLENGRAKFDRLSLADRAQLQVADAEQLPFHDNSFDAVSISFGIRNLTDTLGGLKEMHRVLTPGGRALILEFSLPTGKLWRRTYLFYLRHILPHLGRIISGDDAAYRYLNETIETFPHGEAFGDLMLQAGLTNIQYTRLSGGIATLYRGDKE